MKYDKEIIDIVKKKEFKTFWHCFDYLNLAGYSTMDAFGISILEFGEDRIYSNVAFGNLRVSDEIRNVNPVTYNFDRSESFTVLRMGLIGDNNIHLSGLYGVYRKWNDTSSMSHTYDNEIENTCEIVQIKNISPIIIDYLHELSIKHFGSELFKIVDNTSDRRFLDHMVNVRPQDPRYTMSVDVGRIPSDAVMVHSLALSQRSKLNDY